MSNDPNLNAEKPKRPRTVGMYDRPNRPAISPAILIALLVLIIIIVAAVILFVLPH